MSIQQVNHYKNLKENELYHYGVKGMKWGVSKEKWDEDQAYLKKVEAEKQAAKEKAAAEQKARSRKLINSGIEAVKKLAKEFVNNVVEGLSIPEAVALDKLPEDMADYVEVEDVPGVYVWVKKDTIK